MTSEFLPTATSFRLRLAQKRGWFRGPPMPDRKELNGGKESNDEIARNQTSPRIIGLKTEI